MATIEDQMAEAKAEFEKLKTGIADLKSTFASKIAAEKARADEAEKKLEAALAAASSAVPAEAFKAFSDELIAGFKGVLE